ncbi:MAG: FHA domain-containing protein [Clostridia bacterium]|nr:FHA domain-containing protein [Clostridia bacterium]
MPQISMSLKKGKAAIKIRLNKLEYVDNNRIGFPIYDKSFITPTKIKKNSLMYNISNVRTVKDYISDCEEKKFDVLIAVLQALRPCSMMEIYWKIVVTDPEYVFINSDGAVQFICVPVSNFETFFDPKKMIMDICKDDNYLSSSGLMESFFNSADKTVDNLIGIINSVRGGYIQKQSTFYSGTTVLSAESGDEMTVARFEDGSEEPFEKSLPDYSLQGTTLLQSDDFENDYQYEKNLYGTVLLTPEEDNFKNDGIAVSEPELEKCDDDKEQTTFDRLADKHFRENYCQSEISQNIDDDVSEDESQYYRDGMTVLLSEPVEKKKVLFVLERISTGERVPVKEKGLKVGSNEKYVDWCLSENKAVSSYHALFSCNSSNCCVRDNMSTNGTYINGNKIEPFEEYPLSNGDEVSIADEVFNFIRVD